MSRRINQKCSRCSLLPVEEAQRLHGVEGDCCWDDLKCHKRRSHYRHRSDRNARRAVLRHSQKQASQPETLSVAINSALTAQPVLIIYSEQPHHFKSSTQVHAVGAELWVGTRQYAKIEPIHCFALSAQQVRLLLIQILEVFSEHYLERELFTKYFTVIHRHVRECPVRPCSSH